jgi:hypothetical protein
VILREDMCIDLSLLIYHLVLVAVKLASDHLPSITCKDMTLCVLSMIVLTPKLLAPKVKARPSSDLWKGRISPEESCK